MASIRTKNNEQLSDQYPEGAYNPHIHQYGIIAKYLKNYNAPIRSNDYVETKNKLTGLNSKGRDIKN